MIPDPEVAAIGVLGTLLRHAGVRGDRLGLRFGRLILGLVLFGLGIACMARANLGLGPWAALHDGVSRHIGLPLGTVDMLLSVPILLLWLPLRERPGPGTLLTAVVLGGSTNVGLVLLPPVEALPVQVGLLTMGITLTAIGSALYLSINLGAGPRDGLMTGIQRRFGWSVVPVRTTIEGSVLIAGALLGGSVGFGTVAYALAIGPGLSLAYRRVGAHHLIRPPRLG